MAQRTVLRMGALVGALSVVLAGCTGGDTAGPESPEPAAPVQECEPIQAVASGQPSTDPLTIGSLLPETGDLSYLGPPEFAGLNLAVEEINEAGGVLGEDVIHLQGDSGDDSTDTANQTVDRHLGEGVQVIVGAAASGVSKLVIDKITGAGVVMFSPANTSDEFTCWEDEGLYFRTAPPDVLQAQALAQLIASDGAGRVSILARNDAYGGGLADNLERNLVEAGLPESEVQKIVYDPRATSYNTEIEEIRQFDPDAIAVIGFDESKRILTRMSEVQIGPADKAVYGSDGNMDNALGEGLPEGLLAGMKGTAPRTELSGDFQQRLLTQDPDLNSLIYSAETYDAVVIVALAAEQAGSTRGVDIASEINDVTRGGEVCETFAECRDITEGGGDVQYDGITGTQFTDHGEPGVGSYGILEFTEANELDDENIDYVIVGQN